MKSLPKRKVLASVAVVAPLLLLLFFDPGVTQYWIQVLFDWLHVGLFAVVTIGLYTFPDATMSTVSRTRLSAIMAVFLAFFTEFAQIPTARDSSWTDIGSNLAGILIALLFIPAFTTGNVTAFRSRLLGFVILAISVYPAVSAMAQYVERNRLFPVIANESWPTHDAFSSTRDSAIDFRNVVPDWTGYASLVIDLDVHSEQPLPITVRVHDKQHRNGPQPHSDRFNRKFALPPGESTILIAMEDIAMAPDSRRMDLTDIDGLVIFTNNQAALPQFEIREIRLSHPVESMLK